jgi:hypothetical protein
MSPIQRGIAWLGWPGVVGCVLLILSMAWDQGVNRPLEAHIADQRSESLKRDWIPAPHARNTRTRPGRVVQESAVRLIIQEARNQGVRLEEGSYSNVGRESGGPLQLDLPLSAPYPNLRVFLEKVLEREPALTLEALELRRESVEDSELEGHARFSLAAPDLHPLKRASRNVSGPSQRLDNIAP